jgi:hypothetical protein
MNGASKLNKAACLAKELSGDATGTKGDGV